MSFFWGSSETSSKKEAENSPAEVEVKAKEFDDLLLSKDLELQAILDGDFSSDTPSKPPAATKTPSATSEKARTSNRSVPEKPVVVVAATDTKLNTAPKLIFGVPRNYIIVVFIIVFMGGILFKYMDAIWSDTQLNEKVIASPSR
mmetsp:Transcript_14036/g.23797  ORF Transcript_14036/g.23797 Transcript_14036/m.23797 type:complete len:145 (+) Transcript_14036:52-486(+)